MTESGEPLRPGKRHRKMTPMQEIKEATILAYWPEKTVAQIMADLRSEGRIT